jgi:hypothetical protein
MVEQSPNLNYFLKIKFKKETTLFAFGQGLQRLIKKKKTQIYRVCGIGLGLVVKKCPYGQFEWKPFKGAFTLGVKDFSVESFLTIVVT